MAQMTPQPRSISIHSDMRAMTYPTPQDSCLEQPKRSPEVFDGLERVDKSVALLSSHLFSLADRLVPVLRQAPPISIDPEVARDAGTLLGQRLTAIDDRLLTMACLVSDLIDRLEI